MERYKIEKIGPLPGIVGHILSMKQDENGDYVKYEDVKKLIRSVLNVCSDVSPCISDEEIEGYINDGLE